MNKVSGSFYTFAPLFVNSFVIFVCVCLSAFKADKSLNWAAFFFSQNCAVSKFFVAHLLSCPS